MLIDIKVPEAGESVTHVELARWLVYDGQYVEKDQEIAEIDSDKATLTINADASGKINIILEEGSSTTPGHIIGKIDTGAERPGTDDEQGVSEKPVIKERQTEVSDVSSNDDIPAMHDDKASDSTIKHSVNVAGEDIILSPQAKRYLEELKIDISDIYLRHEGRRITRRDILNAISESYHRDRGSELLPLSVFDDPGAGGKWGGTRKEDRQKMSTLRRKIAERLVAVKNQTAMLTTFNEVDMSEIIAIRSEMQDAFTRKYGFKLGYMSFFAKAVAASIPSNPQINGYIDGEYLIVPDYVDIGIAVSTPRGLMVPVIRNVESLSIAELESKIQEMAKKAREGKIAIEDLKGGTFSITNGGIFGSMLSTPIINPPQSAILGMHTIQERPVVKEGKIVIRPMMYLALSYDHRVIDGKESVGFLVKLKEIIENPKKALLWH